MIPQPLELSTLQALEDAFHRRAHAESAPLRRTLGWSLSYSSPQGPLLLRRLPSFPDSAALARWQALSAEYSQALIDRGLGLDPGCTMILPQGQARVVFVAHTDLRPDTAALLREASRGEALVWLDSLLERLLSVITPQLGLVPSLERWRTEGGALLYLGAAEPLLRDAQGQDRLPLDLRLAGLPRALWPWLRGPVKARLDRCYEQRGLMLDLLASLLLHRLDSLLPACLERVNCALSSPIGLAELHAHHAARQRARGWILRMDGLAGVV